MSLQSCLCGIAVVVAKDVSGFPESQWALALHLTDYRAPDVRTFHIIKDCGTTLWRVHQFQGALEGRGTCAVFHPARLLPDQCSALPHPRSLSEPEWVGKAWTHVSCAIWVLRAIEVMVNVCVMREPACPLAMADVYDKVIVRYGVH